MESGDKVFEVSDSFGMLEETGKKTREDFTYKDIDNFYNRVMGCMGLSGGNVFQEEVLDYPENAPTAERRVKSLVPNWVELDEEKFKLFQTCIIYMTCYILCPIANSRKVSQQTTPSLTLKFADSATQPTPCKRYLDLLNDLLAEIAEEEQTSFLGFRVTKSSECRGRVIWPTRLPH